MLVQSRRVGAMVGRVLLLIVVTAAGSPASALTQAGRSSAGESPSADPSTVTFEHDGRNTTGFALYVVPQQGEPLRIDLGPQRPDSKGRITVALPPLPPGVYGARVAAYNSAGESNAETASPERFQITTRARAATPHHAESDARQGGDGKTTSTVEEERAKPPEPPKKGGGVLGRIWKGVVGN